MLKPAKTFNLFLLAQRNKPRNKVGIILHCNYRCPIYQQYVLLDLSKSIIQNQCTMPFHTKLLLISFSFFALLLYYLMHFEISETGNNEDKLSNPSWYFRNWTVAMGKNNYGCSPLLIIDNHQDSGGRNYRTFLGETKLIWWA